MSKKTAVQQIIEALEDTKNTKCTRLHEVIFFDGVLAIIEAGGFLQTERQQIIEAVYETNRTGEQYYNDKFVEPPLATDKP